jgi:O-acetyl-ADP-ribose deacetylase (regulator of RNase III)
VTTVIGFNLPPLTLEIAEGNIANEGTDAIVNAANNAFWMGSGVAGAIKSAGGQQIEDEAMAQGPVEPGVCVKSSAGRLRARAVIHAAVMGQDLRTSADLIRRATLNALAIADANGFASMAFPAFGTGVGGFAVDACARIMIQAIRERASSLTSLRLVRLVLFGRPAHETFVTVARELLEDRA